jgi:hypothetical protein
MNVNTSTMDHRLLFHTTNTKRFITRKCAFENRVGYIVVMDSDTGEQDHNYVGRGAPRDRQTIRDAICIASSPSYR